MFAIPVSEIARLAGVPERTASRRLLIANVWPDVTVVCGARAIPLFNLDSVDRVVAVIKPESLQSHAS